MTTSPRLSKSRYLSGTQCPLRLWYDTFAPELAPAPDDVLQATFDTGHEVGEAARRRYPGGHWVAHDHRHIPRALEETRQIIVASAAPALFEAAFEHDRVLIRADVLERLPAGGWCLVEVKSSTRLKDVFLLNVAVQLWVLRGAAVLTLNRDYVYDGVRRRAPRLGSAVCAAPRVRQGERASPQGRRTGARDAGNARPARRT